uniref:ATP synthase F0 subunit 8 n=1 Tax=Dolicheulota formosensis TaxID=1632114 RepID=A0A0H3W549_DOLFO|nr:ATP synthase F0 subunit 8 [Dolicheulota formosensis]AKJ85729.1 ATP synthase F0 subunit 8 [Dolicheulota formosensis]
MPQLSPHSLLLLVSFLYFLYILLMMNQHNNNMSLQPSKKTTKTAVKMTYVYL